MERAYLPDMSPPVFGASLSGPLGSGAEEKDGPRDRT